MVGGRSLRDRFQLLKIEARPDTRRAFDALRPVYFLAGSCGRSTLMTRSKICVSDSSLTLSVFEITTGPGVVVVGPEVRLRPFNPITPWGIPTLMAGPLGAVSNRAADDPVAAWVDGDCFTVRGTW